MLGIFFLSFSSSGINQIQERKYDSKMPRTSGRPLPSGQISVKQAWLVVVINGLAGSLLLWLAGGKAAMLLGWLNILLYNGIYTPLKTRTLFAMVPGSAVGAIPPLIGWISAGGHPFHVHIVLLAMFFFVGQIPHTWLILIRYDLEYRQAGLPSLSRYFNQKQTSKLTFIWATATSLCIIMLGAFGLFSFQGFAAAGMGLAFMMVFWFAGQMFGRQTSTRTRSSFVLLNGVYLCVMLMIIIDSLLIQ